MQKTKPCVLMFAPSCYPPSGAEAIVTSKLVLAMIAAGWQVKVISQADFSQYYPTSENNNWKPLRSVVENIIGLNDNSLFARLFGEKIANKLRAIFWVMKATKAGFAAYREEKYDFLLSRAAPQYGHLPALILKYIIKIPWLANWSDPLPPKKAPPPYGAGYNAKISFFLRQYYCAVFRNADWHTFPCERLLKYYWQMAPDIESKSSVIPHIALQQFNVKINEDKSHFTICHTGGLALRDPSVFLEGLKRFITEIAPRKNAKMIFVGDDSQNLATQVKSLGLVNYADIVGVRPYEQTMAIAASASILLVIEALGEEGIFFPSKFVDFVQTGRPVLAVSPIPGTLHDILSCYGGGIAVDNRCSDEISAALNILYTEWEKCILDTNFGSSKLFDHFSADYVIARYTEIFSKLAASGIIPS